MIHYDNNTSAKRFFKPVNALEALSISTISLCLFVALSLASGKTSISAFIIIWTALFLSFAAGRQVYARANVTLPSDARFCAELLTGLALVSLATLAICLLFGYSAGTSFLMVCTIGLAAEILGIRSGSSNSNASYGAIAVVCGLSIVWSWQAIWAAPSLYRTGAFPAWQDFFFHSSMISQFAHFSEFGGTWIFAHGTRLPVYHYASYAIPSVVKAFSDLPSIAIATGFAEPFSFIVMGLGTWVLGIVLAGRVAAATAIAAIFLLPNAAYYGFGNAYYDFHWLLQITTTGYAIGFSLLALAVGIIAVRDNSTGAFWIAAALALATSMFKMQLFPLLILSGIVIWIWFWHPKQWWMRWACVAVLLLAGTAGLLIAEIMPRAPHFLSTTWEPKLAVKALLLPNQTIAELPDATAVALGLGILLLTAFGGLVPLYIVANFLGRRKFVDRKFDLIPGVFIAVYALIVLMFPRNTSDEFSHRSFTLVYAVVAVWCACMIARIAKSLPLRARIAFLVLGLALLPFPFFLQSTTQSGRADWMKTASHTEVPRGLVLSADYIRHNALTNEITLKSSNDGFGSKFGELTALCERSAFILLVGTHLAWELWGTPIDVVTSRESVAHELLRTQNFEDFSRTARSAGINWYILSPPDRLPDPITDKAVLSADGYFVFHIPNAH
jgi:hypothetical protein